MELLALGEAKLELGTAAPVDEQAEGDERQALRLGAPEELVDLAPMEQQLPIAPRLVVVAVALGEGGDGDTDEPGLAALDPGIGLLQADLAGPDALDLGAGQGDARLDVFFDVVLVVGLPIEGHRVLAHQLPSGSRCGTTGATGWPCAG